MINFKKCRLIQHLRNQDIYIITGSFSVTFAGQTYNCIGYRSTTTNQQVHYFRVEHDFHGFVLWQGKLNGNEFSLLDTCSVKESKLKLNGTWVSPTKVSQL